MGKELVNSVTNFYGPRSRGDVDYAENPSIGIEKELVIWFTGANYSQVEAKLPAGATVHGHALVEVLEVFVIGGTTPNIAVGVDGSETTNYIALIPEASLEALGTYSIATAGTLAVNTPLAAEATIAVALEGDTTVTSAGLAKVVVQYRVL